MIPYSLCRNQQCRSLGQAEEETEDENNYKNISLSARHHIFLSSLSSSNNDRERPGDIFFFFKSLLDDRVKT